MKRKLGIFAHLCLPLVRFSGKCSVWLSNFLLLEGSLATDGTQLQKNEVITAKHLIEAARHGNNKAQDVLNRGRQRPPLRTQNPRTREPTIPQCHFLTFNSP